MKSGAIEVLSIDTLEQLAVIFTKALDQKKFEHLRMNFIGWQLKLEGECDNTTNQ